MNTDFPLIKVVRKRYPKRFSRAKRKELRRVDSVCAIIAGRYINFLAETPEFKEKIASAVTDFLISGKGVFNVDYMRNNLLAYLSNPMI